MKKQFTAAILSFLCLFIAYLANGQGETQNTNLPYWRTQGNSGSNATSNFIGTTDGVDFIIKTSGNAATNERLRFLSNGQIVVNKATTLSGDFFAVYGTGTTGAINSVTGQTDFPFSGYSSGAFAGLFGSNNSTGQGVLGSNSGTGVGVYGLSGNAGSIAVFASNQAAGIAVGAVSSGGFGVSAITSGTLVTAIRGTNQNTAGTGIIGVGNNIAGGTVLTGGSGIAANGTAAGIYSVGTNASSGVGVIAGGSNITGPFTSGTGEGVAANGSRYGVTAYAGAASANNNWGGYFVNLSTTNGYAYVAGRTGGVDYGILSAGTKSTMVQDEKGQNRIMFCTEAPEVLFQDFGTGKLTNGRARIKADPLFAKSISAGNTVKVFVQLEGNCNGVYVTNKSNTGFDVIELNGGKSDVTFSWQIVGNRANTYDDSGKLANAFADVRFPTGPGKVRSTAVQTNTLPAVDMNPALPLKGAE